MENLKAIAQERNMETRQMAPFSSSAFPALTVIFIFVFENSQNYFHVVPPWFLLVCKIQQFWAKAENLNTTHHSFLESRHLKVTKNPYNILFQEESQKEKSY